MRVSHGTFIDRWMGIFSEFVMPLEVSKYCFWWKIVAGYVLGVYLYLGTCIYRLMTLYFAGVLGKPRNFRFLLLSMFANLLPFVVTVLAIIGQLSGNGLYFDSTTCTDKLLFGVFMMPLGAIYQILFLGYYTFKTTNVFVSLNEFQEARLICCLEFIAFGGILILEILDFKLLITSFNARMVINCLHIVGYVSMIVITLVKPMVGL